MLGALEEVTVLADDSETLSENVFRRIQAAIVKGEIAPGSKISEPELARTYGISRARCAKRSIVSKASVWWSACRMSAPAWSP